MNRIFAIIIFLIFSVFYTEKNFAADLRPSEVPDKVRKSFEAKYPNTYVYEWEYKRKKGLYEAEFIHKGKKYEALFTPSGEWIRTERDLKKYEIPEFIFDWVQNSEYADWKIDDVEEHNTPEHDLIYEIELEWGKREVYIYLLPNGMLLRTVRKK